MKSFQSNLLVVATFCSLFALFGCQTEYSFSPMPIPNSSGLATGADPLPSGYPQPSQSPGASPTMSASPSPSPSASSCTETCTVPNGVGVQACGIPVAGSTPAPGSIPVPAPSSMCSVTQCNPGYVISNGMCVLTTTVSNFSCLSYEPLVLNSVTDQLTTSTGGLIPAQNVSGGGVCYYYPLYDGVALSGDSSQTGTAASNHDQGVISRDHDADPGNTLDVWHPYSMLHANVNLTFAGPRTLHLTGGEVKGTMFTVDNVQIDNFFLVGVYAQGTALTPANVSSYYSAWGTADSVLSASVKNPPSNVNAPTTGIAFNPAGIDFATNATDTYSGNLVSTPYSDNGLITNSGYALIPLTSSFNGTEYSGGVASVPEVSLTNLIMPEVSTSVDFRGLDCGADRTLGNIYLLIQ
jgi:hypothetical protein